MTTSRRSFLKLAAAAPIAAPEMARAAHAELDSIRARAMFGEIRPLKIEIGGVDLGGFEGFDPREFRPGAIVRGAGDLTVHIPDRVMEWLVPPDPSVLEQMRDHDIFDLDGVPA